MKNKRKVLIVTTTPYMIKQFLMSDIQILLDLNYTVEIATNFKTFDVISDEELLSFKDALESKDIIINQIDFIRSISKVCMLLKSYKQIKTLINKKEYDLIHTHTPIAALVTRVAFKNSKIYRTCKMIYTAHGFHFFKGNSFIKNFLFHSIEKYAARCTDVLITINKEDYEAANHFKLRENGKVEYIPGVGINKKFYEPVLIEENYKKELGISADDFVILSVGELNDNKNQALVIKSIYELNNEKVHYLIVGSGVNKNKYNELIKKLKLEKQVHLLGYRKDIKELNEIADLFALPSLREGLALAGIEAMACGTPVVALKTRGIIGYLIHGETGFIIENNSISCKNAIIKYMNLGLKAKKEMSINCRKKSLEYSKDIAQKLMRNIYMKRTEIE